MGKMMKQNKTKCFNYLGLSPGKEVRLVERYCLKKEINTSGVVFLKHANDILLSQP
jgi:hypothetical protein